MLGTIFSILIAAFILFNPLLEEQTINVSILVATMIAVAILFLFILPAGIVFSWLPLQKAEKNSTPRILDLFHKDSHVRLTTAWLVIFPLASIALAIDAVYIHILDKKLLFAVWIILLGLAIDASQHLFKRILNYLNPFSVVEFFTKEAYSCIQNEREIDLCNWIDALAEISIKASHSHSTSLSNAAITEQQKIASLFLKSSKSISHHTQDAQSKELGIADKVSYTMFYLYQRLELEFDKALSNNLEPICSNIILNLGKIAIDAAQYDISMASAPLRFLGKFANKAQAKDMQETVIKASCTLLGVARAILSDIDITYLEIKDPFLSIISNLEDLAKNAFRKDKTTSIPVLIQPFLDLKQMFSEEKTKNHQDTPIIMQNIDRVLGEFEALQMVLNTLPTIPNMPEDITPPQKEEKRPYSSP